MAPKYLACQRVSYDAQMCVGPWRQYEMRSITDDVCVGGSSKAELAQKLSHELARGQAILSSFKLVGDPTVQAFVPIWHHLYLFFSSHDRFTTVIPCEPAIRGH